MICPYCQAELDPTTMSCGRCGAAYPMSGASLGLRLRGFAIAFVLLVITSLIMVDCVLHNLPRSGLTPDTRSPQAERALIMMERHQQESQNPASPPPQR